MIQWMRGLAVVSLVVVGCGGSGSAEPDAAPRADATPISGEPHALTRQDLSVLWPLPPAGQDLLLRASDEGKGGPLVPRARFDEIGQSLIKDLGGAAEEHAALRVVAARFDPCFRHNWGGTPCQPQVRLVLQAVDVAGATTFDGALHALYNLTEAEFRVLADELRALTAAAPENAAPDQALGVSPALAAQGVDGVYGQNLAALLLRHVGAANLARLTFMTRSDTRAGQWVFGGRAIIENQATGFGPPGPIPIAGSFTSQEVTQLGGASYDFEIEPYFMTLSAAGVTSVTGLESIDQVLLRNVHDWAIEQENPVQTTPDSTDCASCHVGGKMAATIEAIDPTLVTEALAERRGPRVITAAEDQMDNLRSFGYFGATPYIAQRVANDSEQSLSGFATLYPPAE
jgi:hypothetical protein